jgi:hypothetical protein
MSCGSLRTLLRFIMRIPQRNTKRPANTQLAGSAHWYDLPTATLQAWVDEWRTTHPKHTPAVLRVKAVCGYLCSRQRWRAELQDNTIQETEQQIADGLSISLGSVCDVIAFLDWLGVLPTLRAGGQHVATTRQLLRPEFSLRWGNPVTKETERNGIQAERNGETHRSQRAQPHYSKSPSDQVPTPPLKRAGAVVKKQQVRDKPAHSTSAVSAACRECYDTGYAHEFAFGSGSAPTTNPCSKGCAIPEDEFAGMSEQELQELEQTARDEARAARNKLAEKQDNPARWLVR